MTRLLRIKKMDKISQNSRLLIASLLACLIIFLWQYFYLGPMMKGYEQTQLPKSNVVAESQIEEAFVERGQAVAQGFSQKTRVKVENNKLIGSINLVGARIDDIVLKNYKSSMQPDSPNVALFAPSKTESVYFAEFGWSGNNLDLPNSKTLWHADRDALKMGETLTLSWVNSKSIRFLIKLKLDDNYLFTITHELINNFNEPIHLSNYSLVNRAYEENGAQLAIIHEGPIGVIENHLEEISYGDIATKSSLTIDKAVEWLGFTDKYWLAAMVPSHDMQYSGNFSHAHKQKHNRYQ